jgi:hypothetical protein
MKKKETLGRRQLGKKFGGDGAQNLEKRTTMIILADVCLAQGPLLYQHISEEYRQLESGIFTVKPAWLSYSLDLFRGNTHTYTHTHTHTHTQTYTPPLVPHWPTGQVPELSPISLSALRMKAASNESSRSSMVLANILSFSQRRWSLICALHK